MLQNKEEVAKEGAPLRIVTDYIRGENEAFSTLRFSAYTVRGRQNDFFNSIRDAFVKGRTVTEAQRIIAANHEDKFGEIKSIATENMEKPYTIYVTKIDYNFEMVIIDKETVFIHFRQLDQEDIITSTLRINNSTHVAEEFYKIFDAIVKRGENLLFTVECKDLDDEKFYKKIPIWKEQFEKAVLANKAAVAK